MLRENFIMSFFFSVAQLIPRSVSTLLETLRRSVFDHSLHMAARPDSVVHLWLSATISNVHPRCHQSIPCHRSVLEPKKTEAIRWILHPSDLLNSQHLLHELGIVPIPFAFCRILRAFFVAGFSMSSGILSYS